MTQAWVDGWMHPEDRAVLGVWDRGFTLGDGLFETVRVYEGTPFRLEVHLRRLEEGLARLGMAPPGGPGLGRVREGVMAILKGSRHENEVLRITVTRGTGTPGLSPPEDAEPTVAVTLSPYEARGWWYQRGLSAVVTGGRVKEGALTAGLKHLGYLEFVMAYQEALRRGSDDGILLTGQGNLAEATAGNLFVVRRDIVLTPGLREGVLPGITRGTVLELAARHDLPVWEGALPRRALAEAQEVFITSSLRELAPVVEVNGEPVGDGRPGPVWERLRGLYREQVRMETGASLASDL